jgi:tetratricopeptide (TPR) repeat protein
VLGGLHKERGSNADAVHYFQEALAIREQVVREVPDEVHPIENLSRSYYNLADLFQDSGKPVEAEQAFRKAITCLEDAAARLPAMREFRSSLFVNYYYLNQLLEREARPSEDAYRRMLSVERELCDNAATADDLNTAAWNLIAGPFPHMVDPPAAIALARKAVDRRRTNGLYWNTLGAAYYRGGQSQQSREAFAASMLLRKGGDGFDWFFLAMLDWQCGEKETARQWYDRAVQWMDRQRRNDPTLLRLKAEAQRYVEPSAETTPTYLDGNGDQSNAD